MVSRRSYIFGLIITLSLAVALALPASTAFAQALGNQAPENTVPDAQELDEDTTLVFSEANLNPISVGDADAGASDLQVTLTATNGTVSLGALVPAGLEFRAGTGVGDALVIITGTIDELNSALESLSFTPTLDFVGPHQLDHCLQRPGLSGPA